VALQPITGLAPAWEVSIPSSAWLNSPRSTARAGRSSSALYENTPFDVQSVGFPRGISEESYRL
jgi:hypothetical protein